MRKCLPIVLLLYLGLAPAVSAQQDSPLKQRIGLQVGHATPTGDFDKVRFEDDLPPFAGKGLQLSGSYSRDVKPSIALGGTAGWRWSYFDLDRFAAEDDERVRSREATAWKTVFALADVYLQHRGESFFGYIKGSLGGALNKSPHLQINTNYGPILRTSATSFSVAGGLAGGVGVEAERIGLSLEIGSLVTRPTFEVTDAKGTSTRYRQAMNTVQVSLGVYYKL